MPGPKQSTPPGEKYYLKYNVHKDYVGTSNAEKRKHSIRWGARREREQLWSTHITHLTFLDLNHNPYFCCSTQDPTAPMALKVHFPFHSLKGWVLRIDQNEQEE